MTESLDDERRELTTLIESALIAAFPALARNYYADLRNQLTKRLFGMITTIAAGHTGEFPDAWRSGEVYKNSEKRFLTEFLDSLPSVSGALSSEERDKLDALLAHGMGAADVRLPETDREYAVNRFRDAMKLYAGLTKVDKELGEEAYEERIASLLEALEHRFKTASYLELRTILIQSLESAELNLRPYQLENVADQLLWLFRDYFTVSEELRDEIYERGEQRILISTFDPAGYPQTARRTA